MKKTSRNKYELDEELSKVRKHLNDPENKTALVQMERMDERELNEHICTHKNRYTIWKWKFNWDLQYITGPVMGQMSDMIVAEGQGEEAQTDWPMEKLQSEKTEKIIYELKAKFISKYNNDGKT